MVLLEVLKKSGGKEGPAKEDENTWTDLLWGSGQGDHHKENHRVSTRGDHHKGEYCHSMKMGDPGGRDSGGRHSGGFSDIRNLPNTTNLSRRLLPLEDDEQAVHHHKQQPARSQKVEKRPSKERVERSQRCSRQVSSLPIANQNLGLNLGSSKQRESSLRANPSIQADNSHTIVDVLNQLIDGRSSFGIMDRNQTIESLDLGVDIDLAVSNLPKNRTDEGGFKNPTDEGFDGRLDGKTKPYAQDSKQIRTNGVGDLDFSSTDINGMETRNFKSDNKSHPLTQQQEILAKKALEKREALRLAKPLAKPQKRKISTPMIVIADPENDMLGKFFRYLRAPSLKFPLPPKLSPATPMQMLILQRQPTKGLCFGRILVDGSPQGGTGGASEVDHPGTPLSESHFSIITKGSSLSKTSVSKTTTGSDDSHGGGPGSGGKSTGKAENRFWIPKVKNLSIADKPRSPNLYLDGYYLRLADDINSCLEVRLFRSLNEYLLHESSCRGENLSRRKYYQDSSKYLFGSEVHCFFNTRYDNQKFVVNGDGTISPLMALHLCLGTFIKTRDMAEAVRKLYSSPYKSPPPKATVDTTSTTSESSTYRLSGSFHGIKSTPFGIVVSQENESADHDTTDEQIRAETGKSLSDQAKAFTERALSTMNFAAAVSDEDGEKVKTLQDLLTKVPTKQLQSLLADDYEMSEFFLANGDFSLDKHLRMPTSIKNKNSSGGSALWPSFLDHFNVCEALQKMVRHFSAATTSTIRKAGLPVSTSCVRNTVSSATGLSTKTQDSSLFNEDNNPEASTKSLARSIVLVPCRSPKNVDVFTGGIVERFVISNRDSFPILGLRTLNKDPERGSVVRKITLKTSTGLHILVRRKRIGHCVYNGTHLRSLANIEACERIDAYLDKVLGGNLGGVGSGPIGVAQSASKMTKMSASKMKRACQKTQMQTANNIFAMRSVSLGGQAPSSGSTSRHGGQVAGTSDSLGNFGTGSLSHGEDDMDPNASRSLERRKLSSEAFFQACGTEDSRTVVEEQDEESDELWDLHDDVEEESHEDDIDDDDDDQSTAAGVDLMFSGRLNRKSYTSPSLGRFQRPKKMKKKMPSLDPKTEQNLQRAATMGIAFGNLLACKQATGGSRGEDVDGMRSSTGLDDFGDNQGALIRYASADGCGLVEDDFDGGSRSNSREMGFGPKSTGGAGGTKPTAFDVMKKSDGGSTNQVVSAPGTSTTSRGGMEPQDSIGSAAGALSGLSSTGESGGNRDPEEYNSNSSTFGKGTKLARKSMAITVGVAFGVTKKLREKAEQKLVEVSRARRGSVRSFGHPGGRMGQHGSLHHSGTGVSSGSGVSTTAKTKQYSRKSTSRLQATGSRVAVQRKSVTSAGKRSSFATRRSGSMDVAVSMEESEDAKNITESEKLGTISEDFFYLTRGIRNLTGSIVRLMAADRFQRLYVGSITIMKRGFRAERKGVMRGASDAVLKQSNNRRAQQDRSQQQQGSPGEQDRSNLAFPFGSTTAHNTALNTTGNSATHMKKNKDKTTDNEMKPDKKEGTHQKDLTIKDTIADTSNDPASASNQPFTAASAANLPVVTLATDGNPARDGNPANDDRTPAGAKSSDAQNVQNPAKLQGKSTRSCVSFAFDKNDHNEFNTDPDWSDPGSPNDTAGGTDGEDQCPRQLDNLHYGVDLFPMEWYLALQEPDTTIEANYPPTRCNSYPLEVYINTETKAFRLSDDTFSDTWYGSSTSARGRANSGVVASSGNSIGIPAGTDANLPPASHLAIDCTDAIQYIQKEATPLFCEYASPGKNTQQFVINPDGTVSPLHRRDLCWGISSTGKVILVPVLDIERRLTVDTDLIMSETNVAVETDVADSSPKNLNFLESQTCNGNILHAGMKPFVLDQTVCFSREERVFKLGLGSHHGWGIGIRKGPKQILREIEQETMRNMEIEKMITGNPTADTKSTANNIGGIATTAKIKSPFFCDHDSGHHTYSVNHFLTNEINVSKKRFFDLKENIAEKKTEDFFLDLVKPQNSYLLTKHGHKLIATKDRSLWLDVVWDGPFLRLMHNPHACLCIRHDGTLEFSAISNYSDEDELKSFSFLLHHNGLLTPQNYTEFSVGTMANMSSLLLVDSELMFYGIYGKGRMVMKLKQMPSWHFGSSQRVLNSLALILGKKNAIRNTGIGGVDNQGGNNPQGHDGGQGGNNPPLGFEIASPMGNRKINFGKINLTVTPPSVESGVVVSPTGFAAAVESGAPRYEEEPLTVIESPDVSHKSNPYLGSLNDSENPVNTGRQLSFGKTNTGLLSELKNQDVGSSSNINSNVGNIVNSASTGDILSSPNSTNIAEALAALLSAKPRGIPVNAYSTVPRPTQLVKCHTFDYLEWAWENQIQHMQKITAHTNVNRLLLRDSISVRIYPFSWEEKFCLFGGGEVSVSGGEEIRLEAKKEGESLDDSGHSFFLQDNVIRSVAQFHKVWSVEAVSAYPKSGDRILLMDEACELSLEEAILLGDLEGEAVCASLYGNASLRGIGSGSSGSRSLQNGGGKAADLNDSDAKTPHLLGKPAGQDGDHHMIDGLQQAVSNGLYTVNEIAVDESYNHIDCSEDSSDQTVYSEIDASYDERQRDHRSAQQSSDDDRNSVTERLAVLRIGKGLSKDGIHEAIDEPEPEMFDPPPIIPILDMGKSLSKKKYDGIDSSTVKITGADKSNAGKTTNKKNPSDKKNPLEIRSSVNDIGTTFGFLSGEGQPNSPEILKTTGLMKKKASRGAELKGTLSVETGDDGSGEVGTSPSNAGRTNSSGTNSGVLGISPSSAGGTNSSGCGYHSGTSSGTLPRNNTLRTLTPLQRTITNDNGDEMVAVSGEIEAALVGKRSDATVEAYKKLLQRKVLQRAIPCQSWRMNKDRSISPVVYNEEASLYECLEELCVGYEVKSGNLRLVESQITEVDGHKIARSIEHGVEALKFRCEIMDSSSNSLFGAHTLSSQFTFLSSVMTLPKNLPQKRGYENGDGDGNDTFFDPYMGSSDSLMSDQAGPRTYDAVFFDRHIIRENIKRRVKNFSIVSRKQSNIFSPVGRVGFETNSNSTGNEIEKNSYKVIKANSMGSNCAVDDPHRGAANRGISKDRNETKKGFFEKFFQSSQENLGGLVPKNKSKKLAATAAQVMGI